MHSETLNIKDKLPYALILESALGAKNEEITFLKSQKIKNITN